MNKTNCIPAERRFTIMQFNERFPDDDACLDWLMEKRYPGGIATCSYCRVERKHHRIASKKAYACDYCGTYISPMAGTIFEKSSTSLRLWFYAMYLMASTRCGVSAKQVQRETGVTYKTAWRMFKQIRSMLKDDETGLGGPDSHGVEMDETYFGGVRRGVKGKPGAGDKKKTAIVGIVERQGRIRAMTAHDTKSATLLGMVKTHILPDTTVFTDEYQPYDGISHMKNGYTHKRIKHSEKIYVIGDIHTNSIEGFWSLLKGGIRGVYHSVGKSYLQSYLDEYTFRYNRRNVNKPMFTCFLEQVIEKAE
ncbi:IS1595 family transposase [Acidicapsa dinghuensis]|uniref:IS1595 family transposase n=1 Tax=Acidicapsa dinghuensis TaxID=2218256 RepID=A0ABW1EGB8_9BACT|nr:IS1595 family transposase [Acidicapsa dinghuensis]